MLNYLRCFASFPKFLHYQALRFAPGGRQSAAAEAARGGPAGAAPAALGARPSPPCALPGPGGTPPSPPAPEAGSREPGRLCPARRQPSALGRAAGAAWRGRDEPSRRFPGCPRLPRDPAAALARRGGRGWPERGAEPWPCSPRRGRAHGSVREPGAGAAGGVGGGGPPARALRSPGLAPAASPPPLPALRSLP